MDHQPTSNPPHERTYVVGFSGTVDVRDREMLGAMRKARDELRVALDKISGGDGGKVRIHQAFERGL